MGGAGAGAGLFLGGFVLACIPIFLSIHIGWWFGKSYAIRSLRLRGAVTAVLILSAMASFFYPGMVIWESIKDRTEFVFEVAPFKLALSIFFIPAGLSALIALAIVSSNEGQAAEPNGGEQDKASFGRMFSMTFTKWWFLLGVAPLVLGSAKFWVRIQPNLTDGVSVPAVWGQAIGSILPFGVVAFLCVETFRLVRS